MGICVRWLSLLIMVLVTGAFTGCAVYSSNRGVVDVYRLLRQDEASAPVKTDFNPAFRYLRVQVEARELFVALGYVDASPDGAIEVWYSSTSEVLRVRDGRLVGASMNSGTDWLSVSFRGLPRWNEIGDEALFERSRDVSPGYRYGIREKMLIQRILPPGDSQLQSLAPAQLVWFEERALDGDLPPARYGVDMSKAPPQVVYAEQCLSRELCFSLQRWPPEKASGR